MSMFSRNQPFIAFLLFLVLSFFYYREEVTWLPAGIHNWAQGDRYALALNFYDNGLNFFQPATNSELSVNGMAAPEFPLQSYLAACFAKLIGRTYISLLFRLITLSFSGIAFMVLFQWGKKMGGNFFVSLLPPLFLFTSPVFIYYSCNYLPDTASVSLVMVSFYFLYLFSRNYTAKHGLLSIFFVSTATLIKMSSGIYLVALCLHGFVIMLRHYRFIGRGNIIRLVTAVVVSALVIGLYFLHIKNVESIYHSGVFLSAAKPVNTAAHSYSIFIKLVFENWKNDYFTAIHYALLFIATGAIFFSLLYKNRRQFFFFQWVLNLLGAVCGFMVMGEQLYVHDYYILAIFFPAVLFTVIYFVSILSNPPVAAADKFVTALIIPSMIAMCIPAFEKHEERLSDHSQDGWSARIRTPFEKYNIGKNEKILITSGDPPNTGLVYADRHGLTINLSAYYREPGFLLRMMRMHDLQYLVMGPLQADSLNRVDSCFFKYVDPVVSNNEVRIYKYRGTIEDQYWSREIKIEDGKKRLEISTSFEDPVHCQPKSAIARSGDYALRLSDQMKFMPQLHLPENEIPDTSNTVISATFWIQSDTSGILNFVAQSIRSDTIVDYQMVKVPVLPSSNPIFWREHTLQIPFPKKKGKADAVEIYFWDPDGLDVMIDDLSLEFGDKNKN